ncbi:MAG: aminodeoxychorismate/anthranilate synthase component II [Crocinitomicaceae bacterium]|nr:aminodeoxychorismate/anthranilate synthase component II [Crocinitomicaceae bacterium]MBK8925549.1 aminodeoxychorismate/anthranilate synthase component II [Crocinitomicaceae bacterium]
MRILLIDNYDSFTFNLVHYLEANNAEVLVKRNDEDFIAHIQSSDAIVISPGPGLPSESGQLMEILQRVISHKPVLGICLGFQAIVEHFGGTLFNQKKVKHGVSEKINTEKNSILFQNLPSEMYVGLYHSWAADENNFPSELTITARSENKVIMAFEHKLLPIFGTQFHPESIMTEHGKKMIANFIQTIPI